MFHADDDFRGTQTDYQQEQGCWYGHGWLRVDWVAFDEEEGTYSAVPSLHPDLKNFGGASLGRGCVVGRQITMDVID